MSRGSTNACMIDGSGKVGMSSSKQQCDSSPGNWPDDRRDKKTTVLDCPCSWTLQLIVGGSQPSIWMNAFQFYITVSLECAPRHIRGRDKTLRVWAASVCINQDEIFERNQQVSQNGTNICTCPADVDFPRSCHRRNKASLYVCDIGVMFSTLCQVLELPGR
ncbi:hypothetical protein BJ878DRAFT_525632 [Calycina marina]|uniref:Heterokaryon incompatibility domain-containing protein n=1 Tax=Calycina marina TaxID=1763456 RepID=A0A9P7YVF2_9HELO|nr:hypothetical protein BJ878DRAFT_525632 [Calycina marina]